MPEHFRIRLTDVEKDSAVLGEAMEDLGGIINVEMLDPADGQAVISEPATLAEAEALKSQLAEIGIAVEIEPVADGIDRSGPGSLYFADE